MDLFVKLFFVFKRVRKAKQKAQTWYLSFPLPSKIYVEVSKEQAGGRKGRTACWGFISIFIVFKAFFPLFVKKRERKSFFKAYIILTVSTCPGSFKSIKSALTPSEKLTDPDGIQSPSTWPESELLFKGPTLSETRDLLELWKWLLGNKLMLLLQFSVLKNLWWGVGGPTIQLPASNQTL